MRKSNLIVLGFLVAGCESPETNPDAAPDAPVVDAMQVDAADVDARDIDARGTYSTCAGGAAFALGPASSTNLAIAQVGDTLYAAFTVVPGENGFWFSATQLDGQVVTAPVFVASAIQVPESISINGPRAMVLGSQKLQPLELDGTAPVAAADGRGSGRVVSGPGSGFRVVWSLACTGSYPECLPGLGTIEVDTLDRDGTVLATSASCWGGFRITSALSTPDGTGAYAYEHRVQLGACTACPATDVGTLSADGGCEYQGELPSGKFIATQGATLTYDGMTTYLSWNAVNTEGGLGGGAGLRFGRFPGSTVLAEIPDVIGTMAGTMAMSSGGRGAALYVLQGRGYLARLTDVGPSIEIGPPTDLGPLWPLPPTLTAVNDDCFVFIDEHGQARPVLLPP